MDISELEGKWFLYINFIPLLCFCLHVRDLAKKSTVASQ